MPDDFISKVDNDEFLTLDDNNKIKAMGRILSKEQKIEKVVPIQIIK